MIVYVIIALVAIGIGMAISVYAFGTGSKRAKIFKEIYFSIEDIDGIGDAMFSLSPCSRYSVLPRLKLLLGLGVKFK